MKGNNLYRGRGLSMVPRAKRELSSLAGSCPWRPDGGFSSPGFGQGQSRTVDGQKHRLVGDDPITHFSCPRLPRRALGLPPQKTYLFAHLHLGGCEQKTPVAPTLLAFLPHHLDNLNKSRVWIPSHVQDNKDRQREKTACRAVQLASGLWITAPHAIAGETGWPGVVRWPVHPQ